MRRVHIIGIGAGNPDFLTIQAINVLKEVDVFFIPDKGAEKKELKRLREEVLERFREDRTFRSIEVDMPTRQVSSDYRSDVSTWHALIEERYESLIANELAENECGAFLVWGDPTLYDSTLRIIENIHLKGIPFEYDVTPGISSVQALAARHRVPLNQISRPVAIMPGRRLGESFPPNIDDIVVVLDGDKAFRRFAPDDPMIYWGAYIGTDDEVLISGRLSEVMNEIETVRDRKQREKGWIMDSYLLRRSR